jgi:hypothetical protein
MDGQEHAGKPDFRISMGHPWPEDVVWYVNSTVVDLDVITESRIYTDVRLNEEPIRSTTHPCRERWTALYQPLWQLVRF